MGGYLDGLPHGAGTLIQQWYRYDGIFSNGDLNGEVTITGPNGNIMLRNYRDGEVIEDIKTSERVGSYMDYMGIAKSSRYYEGILSIVGKSNKKYTNVDIFPTSTLPPCPQVSVRQHLQNCFGEFHTQYKSWFGEFGLNGELHGEGMHDSVYTGSEHGIWKRGFFLGSKAEIYSLLTKQLSQEDTGKYITYTGSTHSEHGVSENWGPATLTLMVDQNGDLTGLGELTFTPEKQTDPGPHTGPVMFSLCAQWMGNRTHRPYIVAGIFGRTTIPTEFQLGLGNGQANCFGTGDSADRELALEQEKEKLDTSLLTGRMGSVFFTVATDEYWENLRKEEKQKTLEIRQEIEEQSRPKNLLKERYLQYITIKECREIGWLYINDNQIDTARSKMRVVENYYKSASENIDTDSIWESASVEWNKAFGKSFTAFSALGIFSVELYGLCRLNFLALDSFSIPSDPQKIPEKDF